MPQRKVALCIGVNSYGSSLENLASCVHDAEGVAELLRLEQYGYEVQLLLEQDATRRKIKLALEGLLQSDAQTYFIYFSGHGWATCSGTHLCSSDADSIDPGVDLEYLRRLIENVRSTSTVVVALDCCHAGAASVDSIEGRSKKISPRDVSRAVPSLSRGRILIAACGKDDEAFGGVNGGYSEFTEVLLNGLYGECSDENGEVTAHSLYDYISTEMQARNLQRPEFRGDVSGRVVLGRGLEPSRIRFSKEKIDEIERDARLHMEDYQARLAPAMGDLNRWQEEGFKSSCQQLEPILEWFEKKRKDIPMLKSREGFTTSHRMALSRLAGLCAPEVGTVIQRGKIKKKLGGGTFGTVWQVGEVGSDRDVAYKVYHPHDISDEAKAQRFRRGYRAMKQMDHPYIVKVYEFTECPFGFYMDFIDGSNLRDFSGTVEDSIENVSIMITVAETLKHAHLRNVIHRDVKPENILVKWNADDGQWQPYLTDFDLAWFSTASQLTKDALGTWQYSAPEQLAKPTSSAAHAQSVDSYSFGQLCYFIITQNDPVPLDLANNRKALDGRVRDGWLASPAAEFVRLYEECSSKNPKERPKLADICERLYRISAFLRDIPDQLSSDKFVEELVFAKVGLSKENVVDGASFLTLSRKTQVRIVVRSFTRRELDLSYFFHCQEAPLLEGKSTYEQMRKILLARIDVELKDVGNVRKKPGSQAPFEVVVEHDCVPTTLEGVTVSRGVISRVLDILEGGRQ